MSEPDVVAEIDRWFDQPYGKPSCGTTAALMQRARDEIVALRDMRPTLQHVADLIKQAGDEGYAEALEEAARVAERHPEAKATWEIFSDFQSTCAAAIRALKGARNLGRSVTGKEYRWVERQWKEVPRE